MSACMLPSDEIAANMPVVQGSPTWCAREDYVGRPRACSKNNISMINVFTLTNINTKIIEGKLSQICISEVRIKLADFRINR